MRLFPSIWEHVFGLMLMLPTYKCCLQMLLLGRVEEIDRNSVWLVDSQDRKE